MVEVVAIGELLIDFTTVDKNGDGYPTMAAHPGGAPANFLAALSRFGAETAFIGKVGQDAFGNLLKDTLEKYGISSKGLIFDPFHFTTLAFVTLDEMGERQFSFSRKPGADTFLSFPEVNYDLINEAKYLHFGSLSLTDEPSRTAVVMAVTEAKRHGTLISYDPNLRLPLWYDEQEAREQLLWGLKQADVVKISDDEVEFLFGLAPEEGAKYIINEYKNIKLCYVTCGDKGTYFINKNCFGFVPALKGLRVIDTTGAGDVFGGSAMFALLGTGKAPDCLVGAELEQIVRFATAAAGLSTERRGGISSVPATEEVLSKMKEEYK